jgi:hypothetical protein
MCPYVVPLPHCTSQTLIKLYAFEMYVRVRVLDEQEEKAYSDVTWLVSVARKNHSPDEQHECLIA